MTFSRIVVGYSKIIFHLKPRSYSVFLVNESIFKKRLLQMNLIRCSSNVGNQKHANPIDLNAFKIEEIRNFGIIAHIDHGKSTLADRLLEITGTIEKSNKNEQVLDKLQVEKERGITVKAQSASLIYEYKGKTYLLNLIDTPGHVDFSYEVSRSLAACEGVILLVDASQGIQAQTVANFYLAFGSDKTIIPVLNKIDMKNAKPDAVATQMKNVFEIEPEDIIKISARMGTGIEEILESIIEKIPPPSGDINKPFRALLFDSWHEPYKGNIGLICVIDGHIQVGKQISSVNTGKDYEIREIGIMYPDPIPVNALYAGQVGYIVASLRNPIEALIGDTLYSKGEKIESLPVLMPAKPMVFSGIYAAEQSQTVALRSAIEKLTLNDSSVSVTPDNSPALGHGWRLGFLGLLHMDVFSQRLLQEHDVEVILTAPSVPYKVRLSNEKLIKEYRGEHAIISNPLKFPEPQCVSEYLEPMILGTIITPQEYYGKILSLCMERRGVQTEVKNIDNKVMLIQFKLPLNEVIVDFIDELKRISSGFASFDYEEYGYEISNLVKVSILVNSLEIEELAMIAHATKARQIGKTLCEKLKDIIPQQMFAIVIQAAVGGKIIARQDIRAYKKDVTAKLYGGDVTRRMKLLKQQSEGKKKMRAIGKVNVPRDLFLQVLRR